MRGRRLLFYVTVLERPFNFKDTGGSIRFRQEFEITHNLSGPLEKSLSTRLTYSFRSTPDSEIKVVRISVTLTTSKSLV